MPIFLFLPAGEQGIAFMKGYKERGLAEAGIKLIATGDITDDGVLEAMGDPTLGLITSFHYSAAHDSPENKAFVKAYAEVNGTKLRPNFMAVGGYDGMAAIYEALKKTGGSTDAEKVMAALKGLKLASPRGPITIDPDTRDPCRPSTSARSRRRRGPLQRRVRPAARPEGPGEVAQRARAAEWGFAEGARLTISPQRTPAPRRPGEGSAACERRVNPRAFPRRVRGSARAGHGSAAAAAGRCRCT